MRSNKGTSVLETPPFYVALVFTFFLIVTLSFERFLDMIKHCMERRKKIGLLAAMDSMKNELMLLGFATLLLLSFEPDIQRICVPASAYDGRSWLDHVDGCACCLKNTGYVSDCFLRARGCCNATNCDYLDSCCTKIDYGKSKICPPIAAPVARSVLHAIGYFELQEPAPGPASSHALLAKSPGPALNPGPPPASQLPRRQLLAEPGAVESICVGRTDISSEHCKMEEKKRPAIGEAALHQVHIFIFVMALCHILVGVALIVISSMRMRRWRQWTEQDDPQAHSKRVRSKIAEHRRQTELAERSAHAPAGPPAATTGGPGQQSSSPEAAHPMARLDATVGDQAAAAAALPMSISIDSGIAAPEVKAPEAGELEAGAAAAAAGADPAMRSGLRSPLKSAEMAGGRAAKVAEGKEGLPTLSSRDVDKAALMSRLTSRRILSPRGQWPGRPEHLMRPVLGRVGELGWCVARQFSCNIVRREEFHLMRASWYFTHRLDASQPFDFMEYMLLSMEDDYSYMVGLGLAMWTFLILFIVLSAAIGWCVWVFTIISGALLFIINTKLVWIVRYVTRGGRVHTLKPGVFWLQRPWLFQPVIKFLVFFVSFVFTNTIYFAALFGPHSCFFSRTGFQGPQFLPWWATLLVNIVYMVVLSTTTLPLYSLVVQMGSDFKAGLLPPNIRAHLEAAAAEREQERLAARRGPLRSLISDVLPMMHRATPPEGAAAVALATLSPQAPPLESRPAGDASSHAGKEAAAEHGSAAVQDAAVGAGAGKAGAA